MIQIVILILAAGILMTLARRGMLSPGAFDHAPLRRGRLGLADLLIAFGLLIFSGAAAGELAREVGWIGRGGGAAEMLRRMFFSEAAALLAAVYVLIRAAAAVEGGIDGFGLSVRGLPRAVGPAVKGAAIVIPLTLAASSLVAWILTALGRPPPMLAHDTLRVLVESPWGATRWGLIVFAVVVAPPLEEILFRGLMQTSLLQTGLLGGRWPVLLCASLLFAGMHAGIAAPQALPTLFVLAVGLGYAYERTGNLWVPIAMHTIFNALQIAIVLAAPPEALA